MLNTEDMSAWTIDEIQLKLMDLIEQQSYILGFQAVSNEAGWYASFTADGRELWGLQGPDIRLVLLSAYVWLDCRTNPVKPRPMWAPRGENAARSDVVNVPVSSPDPEDLDPTEIAAVYDSPHGFKP